MGSELNRGAVEKNIHVGSGHATVHSVIPQFDNEAYFIIDLTHFGRKGNFRKGEVLMRGFLHDPEAIRGESCDFNYSTCDHICVCCRGFKIQDN